nr:hypothetical protein [Enterococcus faecium]
MQPFCQRGQSLHKMLLQKKQEMIASMTDVDRRQQEIDDMYDYKVPALNKIREDKLEMCFRKLFPDVKFDVEHSEKILFTVNEPSMHSDFEYGQAIVDLKEKAYIKNYKD